MTLLGMDCVDVQSKHFGYVTPMAMQDPGIVTVTWPPFDRMFDTRRGTHRRRASIIFKNVFITCTLHTFNVNTNAMMPLDSDGENTD